MMSFLYAFEKLNVWQEARRFTLRVYEITNKFPEIEKFRLTNQLCRAAISVQSNIAEGSGRNSLKERAHFYIMAYSSLWEILNQLMLAYDLNYIDQKSYFSIRTDAESLSYKIYALRNSCIV